MDKQAFLLKLDELIEEEPGTLHGDEILADLDGWDSFATLGFISLVDSQFGVTLSGTQLTDCTAVSDLLNLVGDQLT